MNQPFKAEQFFSDISQKHLLVIGDLMLDKYYWGTVTRISPEAPVPVVEVAEEDTRLGGAANVALNLRALGAKVSVCGVVGTDHDGGMLRFLLNEHRFDVQFLVEDDTRRTTSKTRVIANQQHTVRLDREDTKALSTAIEQHVLNTLIPEIGKFDALIFEDYNKGMLTPTLIRAVIEAALMENVPVIVDPKFTNFMAYAGCTIFKPNLKELNQALGTEVAGSSPEQLREAIDLLREQMPHEKTLITLSEQGVMGKSSTLLFHRKAHLRKIRDVSGAGDTVVALAALGEACGLDFETLGDIANLAGGLVCEEVGVVPVDKERLLKEINNWRLTIGNEQ